MATGDGSRLPSAVAALLTDFIADLAGAAYQ